MDDDWDKPDPNYKPFFLITDTSPEEEAEKDGFVPLDIYNHWKKAQRRLYQKLKAQRLRRKVKEMREGQTDELTKLFSEVRLFKEETNEPTGDMKDLIKDLEFLTLKSKQQQAKEKTAK